MKPWGAIVFFYLAISMPPSAANADMSYEQYEKELSSSQQREKSSKEQIAVEQGHIENLKNRIAELEQKAGAVKTEEYSLLGISGSDVRSAEAEAASISQQLETLSAAAAEELRKRQKEIDAVQQRIASLEKAPVSLVWKIRDLIPPLDQLAAQIKARVAEEPAAAAQPVPKAPAAVTSYTVRNIEGNHESLFKIAARDSVYGDPKKWILLYRSNQAAIDKQYQKYLKDNPNKKNVRPEDLIFPGQVLEVPR
jgi:nucleoid-associated protein YgaU